MSAASFSAFALWAILSVLFLVFLVHHLWCYDRFKCLRWSAGQNGAFKRVMTYTYLAAVPLLVVYSVGMMVVKYREGFIVVADGDGTNTVHPVPISLYRDSNRSWVLPLQFMFSMAWAFEMVTHLEELAFWLYLLHQNPGKEAWFSSWEYRLWYIGSLVAIVSMPVTTLVTRRDIETCDAYTVLVGASGSTLTTLAFLYVLWRFPRFIKHVKAEGADPTVVVRLATFYQLNQVRVVFRFLFTVPLLIVALDGIIGTEHSINRNLFAVDFLQMIGGIGCFVSSMITLLIFFPRSIVREAGYKPKMSSTVHSPVSPKSPPVTPPSRSAPFAPYSSQMESQYYHPLPPHVTSYVAPNGLRMNIAGGTGTGWTATGGTGATTWEMEGSAYSQSLYSPRQSLYDTPQYTTEDEGALERRGSRASRLSKRGSRRVSTMSGRPMDAHPEQDSDAEFEGERGQETEREDQERVPPYPHPPPRPNSPSHPPHQLPPPSQAHIHHRYPFQHSTSSPQVVTLAHPASSNQNPHDPPPPSSTPLPPPAHAVSSDETASPRPSSPSSVAKRRTWDWEERRPSTLVDETRHRRSLHVITAAPGVNLGLGLVGTALGPMGLGPDRRGVVGTAGPRTGRARTSLHPYVANFTSPIDLVDISPHEELPRAT